jgi:pimeloyl-ACP methyl ester carboxylesterase
MTSRFDELTRTFAVNGIDMAWDAWGEPTGADLVLCHGFSGSAHDFALQVPHLAERRRVVTMDHRGHGRSTKTGDPATYSLAQLTADLIAFLDSTTDGPVDLLGHSMGGRIVMHVAFDRPDLVRSLVLMDTSATRFDSDDDIGRFMHEFMAAYDPADGLPDLTTLAGPEDTVIAETTPAWWQERKVELSAGFDPAALKGLGLELLGGGQAPVLDRLGTITCPATVIVGEHDVPFSSQAPEMAAALGDGALEVIAGAWHSPQLTHPTEWRAALERHLSRS